MRAAILRFGLTLSLVVLGFVAVANGSDGALPADIYGRWVVKRLLPAGHISAGPRDLNAVVGTVAAYSASRVRVRVRASSRRFGLDNFVVEHPKYRLTRDSADKFFQVTYISPRDIGILTEYVEEIDIQDADGNDVIGPAALLFIRDKNHLVTIWDGGYFEMVRQR